MTAGIPVLDTAPEIRPASDEEIKSWRINNDPGAVGMMTVGLPKMQTDKRGMMRLIARIEADRATIAANRARIAELETQNRGLTESRTNWRVIAEANDKTIAKQAEEISDLNRRIAVLESDRGKGCNPSRDPDRNDR